NTPFYQLIYRVPVLNQFRVPSRHSFEWTLAASVIAAYGWDALEVHAEKKSRKPRRPEMAIIVALFVITGLTGAMWFRAVDVPPTTNPTIFTALPEHYYWLWKSGFNALLFMLGWLSLGLSASKARVFLLVGTIMFGLFFEQSATIACW